MSLEAEHSVVMAESRANISKLGLMLKADSEGSSSNSMDKSDTSSPGGPVFSPGLVVNGMSIDQNQNCTEAPMVLSSPSCENTDDDSSRLIGEEAKRPTEEELLRQLEEANRLLEADEKSFAARAAFSITPGHSRKGSESSIVSSTSSNSFQISQQISCKTDDPNDSTDPRGSPSFFTKRGVRPLGKSLTLSDSRSPQKSSSVSDTIPLSPIQLSALSVVRRNSAPAVNVNVSLEKSSFSGHSSETLWEIWGRIINDWDSVKKKPTFLRELVRKGIPHEFRGMAWQLILGVHDSVRKQEYAEHMKKKSPCEKLIRRDIARTFPDHDFFKEKDGFGQESLFNVMKACSLHDREVGYCQGSGFIVGLLLMQMPEEDAFAVMVHLMQEFKLRELFKPSMAELGLCMYKLECLIQEFLPTLLVHFQTQNFDTSMYASSWFLTLYVTSLPLSLARRIMDLFVSEGMEMIFRVGVAILQTCQEDLLTLDMEGLLKFLQKDLRTRFEQEIDQDNLLHTAYSIKYSHKKMKKLEKEYTALKTKENEDQIELRRLRTENRLLRQRIENLEKESSTLADKLVQDQVTWAQEVEQSYALKNELSVLRQQLQETQKKLFEAEDIIGDIRARTRIIEDAVHLDEAEERNMVKHLEEELIAVRLREAETAITIKELKKKIEELEDTNLRLQRAPSNDVQQLQEELIAVKLREAEANLSMKELRMKVNEIESYWEAHMERVRQSSPKEKGSKQELRHLQEEVMALKLREARAVADVKDAKQKLMELETQNHICTNQIRRVCEDNKELKQQLEEALEREKDLRTNIKDLTRKLDDTESKRKEEAMIARIKDAENIQQLAELRHKIAEIDIQKEEMLAAGQLYDKSKNQELENKLHDLQDEVLRLQLSEKKSPPVHFVMTDSYLGNNSDEEVETEINDSKNLDRTLSDIIEGKSPSSSRNSVRDTEENSFGGGSFHSASKISSCEDSSSTASNRQRETDPVLSHSLAASNRHSSLSVSDRDVNANTSELSHDGLSYLPAYSGETTEIADSAQKYHSCDSDVKGKTFTASGSKIPLSNANTSSGKNISVRGTSLEESAVKRHNSEERKFKTNISDPDQCFPESWELYEEVVEVGSNNEIISRVSAHRDILKQASLGYSSENNCHTGSNNYNISRESPAVVPQSSSLPEAAQKRGDANWTKGSFESDGGSRNRNCMEKESLGLGLETGGGKEDKIPDVVIIYEPSCGPGSLMCGCEDNDEQDFVLKESTV